MDHPKKSVMVSMRLRGEEAKLIRQAAAARGVSVSEFIRHAASQWVANEDPYYWPTTGAWVAMTREHRVNEAKRLLALAESREAPRCRESGNLRSEAVRRALWMMEDAKAKTGESVHG